MVCEIEYIMSKYVSEILLKPVYRLDRLESVILWKAE